MKPLSFLAELGGLLNLCKMNINTKEKKKLYEKQQRKKTYNKNKESIKQWRLDNLERINKREKQYRMENSEKRKYNRQQPHIREKNRIAHNKWKMNNFTKYKNSVLKKFGITIDTYNKILISQENKCAICGKSQDEFPRALSVDHNHVTGEVRGLLCVRCNTVLGNALDNIDILKNAIVYLQK